MKNIIAMRYFLLLIFMGSMLSAMEAQYPNGLSFEVRLDGNTQRQISESTLKSAKTLTDLYERYPADWILSYISVELSVTCNGEVLQATGSSHELNEEQLSIIKQADFGSELRMDIKYLPDNTLKNKEIREVDYTFLIIPEEQASFKGDEENLEKYIKENAIAKLEESKAEIREWTSVYFSINENGEVENVEFLKSSDDENADEIILNALTNMPKWKPAQTSGGQKVKQNFKFYIGNLNLCAFYEG